MARIIAGTHKGRRLTSVPTDATRPTSDRVKESLFSRLEGYDALVDAVVVDLFAGSGALGLEARSRGARAVELVDVAEPAVKTLRRNAAIADGGVTVHQSAALSHLQQRGLREAEPIELLFLDPPYDWTDAQLAEILAAALPQLHPAATIVVERDERDGEPAWPEGLERFADRAYGSTHLWFLEPQ